MPTALTRLKVREWNVEFKDGKSMVATGTHPAMIHHYVKSFWPDKEIDSITMLPTVDG
jgi:hypothetical protein